MWLDIIKAMIFIVVLIISVEAYSSVATETETLRATVTDNLGESTNVYNFNLSEWRQCNQYDIYKFCWFPYTDINIKKGASEINVLFENIDYIEYDWDMNPPKIEVRFVGGEIITGQPVETGKHWYFKGQTEYGNLKLIVNDTRRIKFDHPEKLPVSADINTPEKMDSSETGSTKTLNQIDPANNQNNGNNNIINDINNYINNYMNNSGNTNYTINNYFNFVLEIVLFAALSFAVIKYVPGILKKRKKSPPKSN
jgi:hypothetical protein